MNIMIKAAVQPAPEDQQEKTAVFQEAVQGNMYSEMMGNAGNSDHIHEVEEKFKPADPAFPEFRIELPGRAPPGGGQWFYF